MKTSIVEKKKITLVQFEKKMIFLNQLPLIWIYPKKHSKCKQKLFIHNNEL